MKQTITREADWSTVEVEFDDVQVELAKRAYAAVYGTTKDGYCGTLSPIVYKEDGDITFAYFSRITEDRVESEIKGPKYVIKIEKRW